MAVSFSGFKKHIAFSGILLLFTGLLYSNILISLGIFLIFINAFIEHTPKEIVSRIRINKLVLLFILLYLFHLSAFFYTDYTEDYLHDIRIKLPLLLIPVGLSVKSVYNKQFFFRVHIFFIILVFFTALITSINYLLNYREINELILESKPIPVFGGSNHIYFGFILAYSVLSGIYLFFNFNFKKRIFKIILSCIIILNFIFIHIIASRTGFIALYSGLFTSGIYWLIIKQQKYLTAWTSITILTIVLFLSVSHIKALNNRFQNTVNDLSIILNNENRNYWSLAQRYEALIIAWEVFKQNPVIGTGMGDLHRAIQDQYEGRTLLLPENRQMPHNQFITYLSGMGLSGFLLFMLIVFFPFFDKSLRNDPFILGVWMAFFMVLFFESILQRQAGIAFFCFFWVYLSGIFKD